MNRAAKFVFLPTALLAISSFASAQGNLRHVTLISPPPRVAVAHPATMRVPVRPAIRQTISTGGTSATTTADSLTASSGVFVFSASAEDIGQLLNPVPGLGFDFAHLAAVNQDLGVRALIDPITQQRLALAERLLKETPFTPVSFAAFEPQPMVVLEQQQPPIIVLQQPQAAPVAAPVEAAASAPAAPATEAAQPPLPEVREFILVLRDGRQIKAVAFTRQNDRIVYITKDGLRRSFAVADLDAAATEKQNQERGTPLQLPI